MSAKQTAANPKGPFSPWENGIDYRRDGLISWRNHVARVLRCVNPEKLLASLAPVIADMEALTTQRILDVHQQNPEEFGLFRLFGLYEWRPAWQDHFQHWQDPVKMVLADFCHTPEGQLFAAQLHAVDGQVLLDFLLGGCCNTLSFRLDDHPLRDTDTPLTELAFGRSGRMLEQLCRALYCRFAAVAPFPTLPVPSEVSLGLNYDRLCPKDLPWNRPASGSEEPSW